MTEIRYWQNSAENSLNENKSSDNTSKLNNFRAFEATMLDTLLGSTSLGSDSANITDMFSSNDIATRYLAI